MSKSDKTIRVNRDIKLSKVRLINAEGIMVGVVSLDEALRMAYSARLDLIEISPNAEPPVCKIADFSKYRYETKRKQNESKKKQPKVSTKEMRFKLSIGVGDLKVKLNKVREFLQDGDKVKVVVWFRGREVIYTTKGFEMLNNVLKELGTLAKVDQEPKMDGKQIVMVLSSAESLKSIG